VNAATAEDLADLRAVVRAYLRSHPALADGRHDPAAGPERQATAWADACRELALGELAPAGPDVTGPELRALAVVAEEAGIGGAVGAFLPSVTATCAVRAASLADHEPAQAFLLGGARSVAVRVTTGELDLDMQVVAGGAHLVSGVVDAVVGGGDTVPVVLACRVAGRPVVIVLDDQRTAAATPSAAEFDLVRGSGHLTLSRTPARVAPITTGRLQRLADVTTVLVCWESLGRARRLLDELVAYAKVREAFGRVIGSFQSVKHQLADLSAELELAAAVMAAATDSAGEGRAAFARRAALAGAFVPATTVATTLECLRLFGGIGYTWEHDAHLHVRRAMSNQAWVRSGGDQHARLAALAGLADGPAAPVD
jgi:3-oxochol-4-en-24-oyl-CoA dehydrogenase